MNDFLTICACNGRRPKNLGIGQHRSRVEQLAKMVRKRNIVRFLVAPSFFGKTALAAEYAESIFSFENVFWINGKSPCFLRDLDRGIITSALFSKTSMPSLVVIEDVPFLDDTRADQLSSCFDEFLSLGWEVIVSMTPACDVFKLRQPDRMCLRSRDLLLSDNEIDSERTEVECLQKSAASFSDAERIPGIFWGEGDVYKQLIQKVSKEEVTYETMLSIFTMTVLHTGTLSDITSFMKAWTPQIQEELQDNYLFLGVNIYRESFETAPFSISAIASVFLPQLNSLAACSEFPDKNILVSRLADALFGAGEIDRACMLVRHMCIASSRASWLASRIQLVFKEGSFLSAHQVFESFHVNDTKQGKELTVAAAWWRSILGDLVGGISKAARVCTSSHADKRSRALASLLLLEYGNAQQVQKARKYLEGCIRFSSIRIEEWCDKDTIHKLVEEGFSWKLLVVGQLTRLGSCLDAQRFIEACLRAGVSDDAVSILIWHFFYKDLDLASASEVERTRLSAFIQRVCDYLEMRNRKGELGFFDLFAVEAIEKACSVDGMEGSIFLSPTIKSMSHENSVKLFSQRSAFSRMSREQDIQKHEFLRTHPDEYRRDGLAVSAIERELIPRLHISLLGRLEVRIGDEVVNERLFGRQSVKTLLALLAVNLGKELSRDRLCEILWPDSSSESAKRSFYSSWSILKKALRTPAGNTPYLIRLHNSCKLDAQLVTSDVVAFKSACRRLHFDPPDAREWAKAFNEISDIYVGDLMPSDTKNSFISQMRMEYKTRLVDAFTTAAVRLYDIREYQAALWFARAAVERDRTREDAYMILMQAQAAVGQRTAALETYFNCRRYLANELGIDPSTKTVLLYNEIIAEEPGLESYEPKE